MCLTEIRHNYQDLCHQHPFNKQLYVSNTVQVALTIGSGNVKDSRKLRLEALCSIAGGKRLSY